MARGRFYRFPTTRTSKKKKRNYGAIDYCRSRKSKGNKWDSFARFYSFADDSTLKKKRARHIKDAKQRFADRKKIRNTQRDMERQERDREREREKGQVKEW